MRPALTMAAMFIGKVGLLAIMQYYFFISLTYVSMKPIYILVRRNIFIEGMDLHALIGKRFQIGEIEFLGSCESSPSPWMDEVCEDGIHDSLKERAGISASILKGGRLDCGKYELEVLSDA